jgi:hypothetical protein
MCNIETVLSSSIVVVFFFAAFVVAGTMWPTKREAKVVFKKLL